MTDLIQREGLLVMQLAFFGALGLAVVALQLKVNAVVRQLAAERTLAIQEVKRVADALAVRTAEIAEDLRLSTISHASIAVSDLDTKMANLIMRFDEIGQRQEKVQIAIDATSAVVQHELQPRINGIGDVLHAGVPIEPTVRDQIESIKESTDELVKDRGANGT